MWQHAFFCSSGDHLRSRFMTGTLIACLQCPASSNSNAGRTSTYLYPASENSTCSSDGSASANQASDVCDIHGPGLCSAAQTLSKMQPGLTCIA